MSSSANKYLVPQMNSSLLGGSPTAARSSTPLGGSIMGGSTTPQRLPPIPSPNDRRVPPPISFPGHSGKHVLTAKHGELDEYHARLKRDALVMQQLLDSVQGRNTLSFEARKLEADLLRSSHEAAPEDRMATMLRIVEGKVGEIAAVAASSASPGAPATPAEPSTPQRKPTGQAASSSGPATSKTVLGPLLEALLGGRQLPPPREPSADGEDATTSPTEPGAAQPRRLSDTTAPVSAQRALATAELRPMLQEQAAALGIGISSTTTCAEVIEQLLSLVSAEGTPANAGLAASPVINASPVGSFASTRPPRGPGGGASPSHARSTSSTPPPQALQVVPPATREGIAAMQTQALMEVEALRAKLAAKDRELQDVRHQLQASRYAFNAPRTLTTVHDAPMSFEVERQYQKELHRLAGRVRELEDDYRKLYDAGEGDRQAVRDMTKQVAALKGEIAAKEREVDALRRERDEQHSLFSGVSKARGEEARMSLVAVKQLESRVADLDDKLRRKTEECRHLHENAASLWEMWHAADAELSQVTSELAETRDLFEAYGSVYHDSLAQQLEEALKEVHRLGRQCDEQTALTTIQKQRIDDFEMLRALTTNEQQQWIEKLKSSTEWKMLSVKSPDETKQLALRIMMLSGEKDKKENTMVQSHAERLALFKSRADREVAERCDRREAAMPIVDAAAAQARWHGEEDIVTTRYAKEREEMAKSGQGGRTTKLRYADVKEAFLEEIHKRTVEFRAFFNDEVEARAAQDVGAESSKASPVLPSAAASPAGPAAS